MQAGSRHRRGRALHEPQQRLPGTDVRPSRQCVVRRGITVGQVGRPLCDKHAAAGQRVSISIRRPLILCRHRLPRLIGGRRHLGKHRLDVGAPIHAVSHQAVQVNIEVGGRSPQSQDGLQPSALAAERDPSVLVAVGAAQAQETVCRDGRVRGRRRTRPWADLQQAGAGGLSLGEESLGVLLHQAVQRRRLGTVTPEADRISPRPLRLRRRQDEEAGSEVHESSGVTLPSS